MPTNAEYAKINIACKELGLDKYVLIADRYRVKSSKDLSRRQTFDLLEYFKSRGVRFRRAKDSKTSPKYDDPQMRKVVAIWITMHKAGVVRNGSDLALQKYVKRVTGLDNLQWCTGHQLNVLIESLKDWAARTGVDLD